MEHVTRHISLTPTQAVTITGVLLALCLGFLHFDQPAGSTAPESFATPLDLNAQHFKLPPPHATESISFVLGQQSKPPAGFLQKNQLKKIVADLLEAESKASEEAKIADRDFGDRFADVLQKRHAYYRDAIRNKYSLTESQLTLAYQRAAEGTVN